MTSSSDARPTTWRTIGFTVDNSGIWASIMADPRSEAGRFYRYPVIGWLTQERGDGGGEVRVVAALARDQNGEAYPAVDHADFIRLEYPDVREVHTVDDRGHRLP